MFLHLSSIFPDGLKAMGDRLDNGFNLMKTLIKDVNRSLHQVTADLQRPAHHFFNQIERGMLEHLTPDLQLNVMQACNAAYMQAMQQSRYFQQSKVAFPPVPSLTCLTSMPCSAAYHCMATTIPSPAGHHYSATTMLSSVGQPTATTMPSAAPAWTSSTATSMQQLYPDPGRTSSTSAWTLAGHPPPPSACSSSTWTLLGHHPPPSACSSSTRTLLGHPPPAPAFSSSTQTLSGRPPGPGRRNRTLRLPRSQRRLQKKAKKTRTLKIPPPSPPNVSVMSSLSLPSSVFLPSHASSTIHDLPDPTSLITLSPATPASSLPSQASQLNTTRLLHSTPSCRS
ncbi:uncharacterized protein [Dendrobates tinctorius]|uniref:uncharacterized protein n=1 Tax=Dendrobates tinctorius TaxID=92724 RepID=UPI003CC9D033